MSFKPGDKVIHIKERWDTPMTVLHCDDQESSRGGTENLTFFEEGGFWRTSQLTLADPEPLFYVQDTRSVVGNSASWWRFEGNGYTCNLNEAWKVPGTWRGRDTDVLRACLEVDAMAERHCDVQKLPAAKETAISRAESGAASQGRTR